MDIIISDLYIIYKKKKKSNLFSSLTFFTNAWKIQYSK